MTSQGLLFKRSCESLYSKLPPYHRSSAIGDIAYLRYNVTSQEHVIEGSHDTMDGSFLLHVTTVPGFLTIGNVVVEIFL